MRPVEHASQYHKCQSQAVVATESHQSRLATTAMPGCACLRFCDLSKKEPQQWPETPRSVRVCGCDVNDAKGRFHIETQSSCLLVPGLYSCMLSPPLRRQRQTQVGRVDATLIALTLLCQTRNPGHPPYPNLDPKTIGSSTLGAPVPSS